MKTEKFQRKPFIVECVQVTAENMADVAKWCGGVVTETDPQIAAQLKKPVQTWIQVDNAQQPMNERQKQAFVGDWVLYANHGFKIYTTKAFERTFEPVFKEKATIVNQTIVNAPSTPSPAMMHAATKKVLAPQIESA